MSLMDADDDEGFAALLDGLHEDEAAEQHQSEQPQHSGMMNDEPAEDEDATDWDAVLAAAEAEEEGEDTTQQQQQQATQTQRYEPTTQQRSTPAAAPPASFSSLFTSTQVTGSFAASVAAALGTSQSATATPAAPSASARAAPSSTPSSSFSLAGGSASAARRPAAPGATPRAVVEFGVSQPARPLDGSSQQRFIHEEGEELRDKITGFRVTQRVISSSGLKEKLQGSTVLTLVQATKRALIHKPTPSVAGQQQPGGALGLVGNWVVFAVVAHKSLPRKTASGKGTFSVWTLVDLEGAAATLMLFGKAFESYNQKVGEGAVIAIANAEDSSGFVGKGNSGGAAGGGGGVNTFKSSLCLSIRQHGQVLHVGTATDFGYCKSFRNEPGSHGAVKGMVKCKNVVNLSKSEFCEYHVKNEYKKLMNARPEINQSRDRHALGFSAAASAAPPRAASVARSQAMPAHLAAKKGGSSLLAATLHASAEATRRMLSAGGASARAGAAVHGATGSTAPNQSLARAALKARETKQSEVLGAASVQRWDALSVKSVTGSRFMSRVMVASTQTGSRGAPTLAGKEAGLMASVEKIAALTGAAPTSAPAGAAATAATSAAGAKHTAATPSRTGSSTASAVATPRLTLADALRNKIAASTPTSSPQTARPQTAATSTTSSSQQQQSSSATKKPTTATPTARPATAAAAARPASASAATAASTSSSTSSTPSSTPAVPSGTFLKSFGATPAAAAAIAAAGGGAAPAVPGSDLVPMLGRGWAQICMNAPSKPANSRPQILNAQERHRAAQAAAQLERVAALRASGTLGKPDPNTTKSLSSSSSTTPLPSNKRKLADGPAQNAATSAAGPSFKLNANGSVTLAKAVASSSSSSSDLLDPSLPVESAEDRASQAKRARLADAFGMSTLSGLGANADAHMEKMLSAATGSKHANLVVESASSVAATEALYNLMKRREALALQMSNITSQQVKAWRCMHPGCTAGASEFAMAGCRVKGHKLERVEMLKRFFTCQGCKFHLSTVGAKLPTHACHKCGGTIWLKASLAPLKVDSSDRDQLQLRSEETFLRSFHG